MVVLATILSIVLLRAVQTPHGLTERTWVPVSGAGR
jgi:hypothetical protein